MVANVDRYANSGYTIVELMVTIVIVSVLAATVGMFFSQLLTIQERDREEAYIREKLADVCGAYADAMSVGSSFGILVGTNLLEDVKVNYRQETGGVSLETGVVTRVAQLVSSIDVTNKTVDVNIKGFNQSDLVTKLQRKASGDALLIPLPGEMISCTITPLNHGATAQDGEGYWTNNAALGYLEVKARYTIKNDAGEYETKTATAGRVVRLWNRE